MSVTISGMTTAGHQAKLALMKENQPTRKDSEQPQSPWQSAKRGAVGVLFFLILLIPRIRRLRRRVWAWTVIRVIAALVGGWLFGRYLYAQAGTGPLLGGLALLVFGLFVRAQPQMKSLDEKARALGALVVLNGGTFHPVGGGEAYRGATILAFPERLLVLDDHEQPLREIPLAEVRRLSARPALGGVGDEGGPWELEVIHNSESQRFHYAGYFGEHLARVAELTLRNLIRKDLPVLKP